jgi:hypothetical protein
MSSNDDAYAGWCKPFCVSEPSTGVLALAGTSKAVVANEKALQGCGRNGDDGWNGYCCEEKEGGKEEEDEEAEKEEEEEEEEEEDATLSWCWNKNGGNRLSRLRTA